MVKATMVQWEEAGMTPPPANMVAMRDLPVAAPVPTSMWPAAAGRGAAAVVVETATETRLMTAVVVAAAAATPVVAVVAPVVET